MNNIDRFLHLGRGFFLAYDHGLEYGPSQFNQDNVDPNWVLNLADSGNFTGFICHKGVAAKYYDRSRHLVPLILKLNGKTSFRENADPLSLQHCSVEEALSLGASGVGYMIHVGSKHEQKMLVEFGRIEREAHEHGIFVLAWMYVEGDDEVSKAEKQTLAYAARVGMELGADGIIVKYSGDVESFSWVVANAGKSKIFVRGGPRTDTQYQLHETLKDIKKAGASGLAIGRNIWQSKHPEEISQNLSNALFDINQE